MSDISPKNFALAILCAVAILILWPQIDGIKRTTNALLAMIQDELGRLQRLFFSAQPQSLLDDIQSNSLDYQPSFDESLPGSEFVPNWERMAARAGEN